MGLKPYTHFNGPSMLIGDPSIQIMGFPTNPIGVTTPSLSSRSVENLSFDLHRKGYDSTTTAPLIRFIEELSTYKNAAYKQALYKKDGLLKRLWKGDPNWDEDKTSLGKVTSLFDQYLKGEITRTKLSQHLAPKTLPQALPEAHAIR